MLTEEEPKTNIKTFLYTHSSLQVRFHHLSAFHAKLSQSFILQLSLFIPNTLRLVEKSFKKKKEKENKLENMKSSHTKEWQCRPETLLLFTCRSC